MAKSSARQWSENALLVTVAGSLIVIIGQLAGTIIPIMYGPEDMSDFSIKLDHISAVVDIQNCANQSIESSHPVTTKIIVEDLHHFLRPYRFNIYFKALGSLDNTSAAFTPREINFTKRLTPTELLNISIKTNLTEIGVYPIVIQGIGGDGKKRNTTFYLRIASHGDYQKAINKSLNQSYMPITVTA